MRLIFIFLACIIMSVGAWAQEEAALPNEKEVGELRAILDKLVKDKLIAYGKKQISAFELANEYVKYAKDAGDKASEFVIFTVAAQYYAEACDFEKTNEALVQATERYPKFESKKVFLDYFRKAVKQNLNAKTADYFVAFATSHVRENLEDFEHISEFVKCLSVKNRYVAKAAALDDYKAVLNEFNDFKKSIGKKLELQKKLKETPDDPKLNEDFANLCVTQNDDWDAAIPYYMKSGNLKIK